MSCDSQTDFCKLPSYAEEVVKNMLTFRLNTCCFKEPADSMAFISFSSDFAVFLGGRDYRNLWF